MTNGPRIPRVLAAGRWWSADEIEGMATRWRVEILNRLGDDHRPVAGVLGATPEAVALFAALTSLPSAAILLAPHERSWRNNPPLPPGTTVVVPPSLAHLAPATAQLGAVPLVLSDRRASFPLHHGSPLSVLQSPGVVLFTSGTTGMPKPVFRSMNALLAGAAARLEPLGLDSGDGLITGVSLAHGHGLTRLLSSMILGGPLALLDPIDYRAALSTLALPEFKFWSATAHFADVLGRCTLTGPAVAPRICLVSSPISRAVFEAFRTRFGVPLRQNYSSSETGPVAVDAAPALAVRPGTVGVPLKGVDVSIGNSPYQAAPSGETGRIWVRSTWQMSGYGFPPDLERPGEIDGWWPTRDVGMFDEEGHLVLAGRIDDCIRTREGRLVNLAFIANSLRNAEGVKDVAVVALQGSAGASFGAVLECESAVTLTKLKDRLSDTLPQWAWPRTMTIVESLPRLPSGKPDRRLCYDMLESRPSS